eukprot:jgi/Ulvmu1/5367/UM022_0161.1
MSLPAQVLEVLSAAVRRDVHNAISALGKDWLFVPVLAAVEQYVAARCCCCGTCCPGRRLLHPGVLLCLLHGREHLPCGAAPLAT